MERQNPREREAVSGNLHKMRGALFGNVNKKLRLNEFVIYILPESAIIMTD